MRIPRDISGSDFISALKIVGYKETRQTGSHIRLTTQTKGEHHVTIPLHDTIRIGTLSGVLREVATHLGITRDELLNLLF